MKNGNGLYPKISLAEKELLRPHHFTLGVPDVF